MLKKPKKKFNINISIGGIKHSEIMLFTKHLAITLKSGMTLFDGIQMLHDQASGKMKSVLTDILGVIQTGRQFSDALKMHEKYFSNIYISMVKTGEISGMLEENLEHLAEQLKKAHELRQKVKSAMMYPIFVLVALVGLCLSVSIFVLPKIVPLFQTLDVELPATTRALIFIAEAFQHRTLEILGGSVLFVVTFFWLLSKKFIKPYTHALILRTPVLKGISQDINLERFARTLGALLVSSIELDTALRITAEAMENYSYKRAIKSFVAEVEQGKTLATALSYYPNLFPKIAANMIGMGEKTGSLDNTLKYLSDFYANEVDATMKNLSSIIEPILLIVIGALMGLVAISILGPIYKITGNLRA